MSTAEFCANCEEPILGQPVYFDGAVFCCAGCTAGGPCICTYEPRRAIAAPGTHSAPVAVAAVSADAPGHQTPAATLRPEPVREPLMFPARDGGLRAIVLRVGGFRDQRDLLEFALALEQVGVLAEVALTRAEPADAWFSLRATSATQVLAALQEVRGWLISANASEAYVEGRVESVTGDAGRGAAEQEPVLPQRPRFRVFSPRSEASAVAGAPATPSPVPAAYEQPAAYRPQEASPVPASDLASPAPVMPAAEPEVAPPAQPYAAPPAPMTPPAAAAVVEPVPAPPAARPRLVTAEPATFHQPDMIAADDRPGGAVPLVEHLTLVVYPFHSFVALNEFQGAIRLLRGVTNTRVRRFYRGTLHLAVDYEDVIPLAERLQDLRGFRWQMVSESRQEIELLLEETGALLAAEGDG